MKNWKTTLFGFVLAGGMFLAQNTTGQTQTVGNWISVLGASIIGLVAKDKDVTGGTIQQ